MISYDHSTRIGNMVPVSVLSKFIRDSGEEPYKGFASAGFSWTPLVDPAKRAYLNLKNDEKGILVLSCMPSSGASEVLKPNDVIIEWDVLP